MDKYHYPSHPTINMDGPPLGIQRLPSHFWSSLTTESQFPKSFVSKLIQYVDYLQNPQNPYVKPTPVFISTLGISGIKKIRSNLSQL
jgi:hypothetical protein